MEYFVLALIIAFDAKLVDRSVVPIIRLARILYKRTKVAVAESGITAKYWLFDYVPGIRGLANKMRGIRTTTVAYRDQVYRVLKNILITYAVSQNGHLNTRRKSQNLSIERPSLSSGKDRKWLI